MLAQISTAQSSEVACVLGEQLPNVRLPILVGVPTECSQVTHVVPAEPP